MRAWYVAASVLVASLVYTGSSMAQTPPAAGAAPAGNAETGKKLFMSYGCYQCHGREAQGSSATGPRLGPKAMPWAAFNYYVRQPTGQMPLYTTKIVTDQELAHIYAYVLSRPAPPDVKTIPLLQ